MSRGAGMSARGTMNFLKSDFCPKSSFSTEQNRCRVFLGVGEAFSRFFYISSESISAEDYSENEGYE